VWVIGAYRAGEQSQMLALAEALGWPFELKPVRYRPIGRPFELFRGTGLFGLARDSAATLVPPWPDLVIGAGMRNEPVCRWVREASGGRTRLVHVGRPWSDPPAFDLVVATPQYRLPAMPQVLQNALTMHRVTPAHLAQAVERHQERLEQLPSPRIAVMVGGSSGPHAFGARAASRLALQASALASELGGSLMISTSSRTPACVTGLLRSETSVPHELYEWRAGDPDNPYFAYLGMADRIIATFDSISMLSEASATCKPLYLFDLDRDHSPQARPVVRDHSPDTMGYRFLLRCGPRRLGRDISLVHDRMMSEGRAVWLGQEHHLLSVAPSPDVERAVHRVRALFDQP
jgi:hypothetical protein